jgi:hypothetical protein
MSRINIKYVIIILIVLFIVLIYINYTKEHFTITINENTFMDTMFKIRKKIDTIFDEEPQVIISGSPQPTQPSLLTSIKDFFGPYPTNEPVITSNPTIEPVITSNPTIEPVMTYNPTNVPFRTNEPRILDNPFYTNAPTRTNEPFRTNEPEGTFSPMNEPRILDNPFYTNAPSITIQPFQTPYPDITDGQIESFESIGKYEHYDNIPKIITESNIDKSDGAIIADQYRELKYCPKNEMSDNRMKTILQNQPDDISRFNLTMSKPTAEPQKELPHLIPEDEDILEYYKKNQIFVKSYLEDNLMLGSNIDDYITTSTITEHGALRPEVKEFQYPKPNGYVFNDSSIKLC